MKYETIIFLVIIFNVVTAFLQKRAKKERARKQAEMGAGKPLSTLPSKPKPASLGKSLLEQLAKELGLRLPQSEPGLESLPPTVEIYAPPVPPAPPPAPVVDILPSELSPHHPMGPSWLMTSNLAESGKKSSPTVWSPGKMREAVVMREILDKPVSLRTGRLR